MLSKKLFGGNKKFSKAPDAFRAQRRGGPHRVSEKHHGPSYRHYRASQRRGSPKITICEIFDVVRFSTFSTASARRRSPAMSAFPPLFGVERTFVRQA